MTMVAAGGLPRQPFDQHAALAFVLESIQPFKIENGLNEIRHEVDL